MGWLRLLPPDPEPGGHGPREPAPDSDVSDGSRSSAALGDGVDGADAVEYREIVDGEMVCGRSKTADWTIDDGTISRKHVRFSGGPDGDHVIDLGSTNGTRVNGRRISGSHPLTDGDEIRVGDRRVIYELFPPAHLAETPVPTSGSTWTSAEAPSAVDAPPDSSSVPAGAHDATAEVEPLGDTERWQSVKLIGRGGMGEVYRATDRDLAMDVAIKRLRRRGDGSEGILGRLHAREAAIARTIRHPNVVQVLEDGIHDGDPYMLLEWIDGPTFDRFLKSPELKAGEKIECLRQVALGLEAAHRAGVVHADMKPANLLVSKPADPTTVENLGILEAPDEEFDSEEEDLGLEAELAARLGLPSSPDFDAVPFVGREGELELLVEIAAELRESPDPYRWVMLFGERGAGKGRLATEFVARLAADGIPVSVEISEEPTGPAEDFRGVWITLLPPLLPDIPELLEAYEREKMASRLHEVYLKPLLRGQTIRLVETLVQHPPSARAFAELVDEEIMGNPTRLIERLEQSFERGAWVPTRSGFRFRPEVLAPDDAAAARELFDRLSKEEKGLRDLLSAISPLGGNFDFPTMLAASGLPSPTLYYLVDHAVASGYLLKDGRGDTSFVSEPFRAALESRVEPKERLRVAKRALPQLHERVGAGDVPAALYLRLARLERQLEHPEKAFRILLAGALRARETYERDRFLACVDEAREIYRETAAKRAVHKAVGQSLEALLGAEGRGYSGLERLRRLPIAVRVHITDFGIARKLVKGETTEVDDAGQPWGTPRYMSPEQARRQALTPASDVFSFGTIVREAFEGRHPLGSLKGRGAIEAIRSGAITGPQDRESGRTVPEALRPLVSRMLAPEPADRPTAKEVAREFERFQLRTAEQVYP